MNYSFFYNWATLLISVRQLRAEFISWSLLERDAAEWATNTRRQVVDWTFSWCDSCKKVGQLLYCCVADSLAWSQRTLLLLLLSSVLAVAKGLCQSPPLLTASSQSPELPMSHCSAPSLLCSLIFSAVTGFVSPAKCTDLLLPTPQPNA